MTRFTFDERLGRIELEDGTLLALSDPRAFRVLSDAWLRSGWDTKYVYGFSWLGRPIIQLPEDMVRIQELITALEPDLVIETGVAHGGSLVFYAGLCTALGKGRVIGIDIEIRAHNRQAIESHRLAPLIQLVEGSSTAPEVVSAVAGQVRPDDRVLVVLDSNHSRDHVRAELAAYAPLVSVGSYIVVCDGIMRQVCGAPRTAPDWTWNNPLSAIDEFLASNPGFRLEEPHWPFNESLLAERVTYWPNAFLKRVA